MSNATETLTRAESAESIATNVRAAADAIQAARTAIREALATINEYEDDDHAHQLVSITGALDLAASATLLKASAWEGYAAARKC